MRSAQTIQYKLISRIKKGGPAKLPFFDSQNFKAPEQLPFSLNSDGLIISAQEILQKSSVQLPPDTDIRILWEQARFQQAPLLAAAYKQTGDKQYLNGLQAQITDWLSQCGLQRTIYWYNAMEVALRSISWVITLVIAGPELRQDTKLYDRMVHKLREQMHFIEHNWEWYDGRTNNHYLSNLVGYAYLCWFFGDQKKIAWCHEQLCSELVWQVFDEGSSYEGSTRYHVLVTELFLHGFLVTSDIPRYNLLATLVNHSGRAGKEASIAHPTVFAEGQGEMEEKQALPTQPLIPSDYRVIVSREQLEKLRRMLLFIERCKINNIPITVGDDDSGIVLHTALAPLPELAKQLGISCDWQAHELMGLHSYPQFGLSLYRSENWHVTLRHAAYHARQPSAHFHADTGSITLAYNGMPIIIDPGSYIYTASPEWRNFFRSAEQHSTIHATGSRIDQRDLFSLDLLAARHAPSDKLATSFTAGAAKITRELSSTDDTITIIDSVIANQQLLTWSFIFPPEIQLQQGDRGWLIHLADHTILALESDLVFENYDTWYAPCYGTKVKTVALRACISVNNKGEYKTVFKAG